MSNEAHVMIVDDDDVLLDLMSRRLERLGFNLDRANNGGEALEFIQRNHYDLIVSDIYMPIATGVDILQSAKEKDPLTQVIVITGGGTIEIALEALEKGAFMYLTKPFDDLAVFDHVVTKALEYRQLLMSKGQSATVSQAQVLPDATTQKTRQLGDGSLRILLSLPDAVMLVNEQGEIVFANPPARTLVEAGWNFKSIPPAEFQEALSSRSNGAGVTVQVHGSDYRLKAVEIPEEHGGSSILFLLHPQGSASQPVVSGDLAKYIREPLMVVKKGLAWLYHQRLAEKEFRVLRAMAAQVTVIERLTAKKGGNEENKSFSRDSFDPDPSKALSDGPQ
jgi:CheY-like chemotaxis protein